MKELIINPVWFFVCILVVLYIDNKLGNYLAKIDKPTFNKASQEVEEGLYKPGDVEFNEIVIDRMLSLILKKPRSQWCIYHYCFVAFRVIWWAVCIVFIALYFSGIVHVN